MRKAVGRVALLLGIVVVAAMAWYGATALFADDPDETTSAPECSAATPRQARAAQREFERTYLEPGAARWLSGVGVSHTDVLDTFDDGARVNGNGSLIVVMKRPRAEAPDLPTCIDDVPLVVVTGGPFQFD